MDWIQIPFAPGYEIHPSGKLRNRRTRKPVLPCSPGRTILSVDARALCALLFTAPEPIETVGTEPEPVTPEPIEAVVPTPEPVATAPAEEAPVEPEPTEDDQVEPEPQEAAQAAPEPTEPLPAQSRAWRPCVGVPGYEINRRGDVRTVNSCRKLPQLFQGDHPVPYVYVTVRGRGTGRKIHVLLEETFGPGAAAAAGYPTPDLAQVRALRDALQRRGLPRGSRACHDCGKPTDNYRCNACWKRVRGYGVGEESAAEEACDAHDAL